MQTEAATTPMIPKCPKCGQLMSVAWIDKTAKAVLTGFECKACEIVRVIIGSI
ncbi:MAG TPA: hypothetical protein VHD34_04700 [Xanthobacteraceae bacterium]|nr:hypothetical protein [Xanthobacteraceae bacterium]